MIRLSTCLVGVLLCLGLPAQAEIPSTKPVSAEAVSAEGERLLAEAVPDVDGPGVALLIARGDTVLFRGARGRASIELGVALSPDQVFRIGSVTKQFAAAALLKLVDEGKARLDDPLSKYLPDFPNGQAITLTMLLDHTSGIRSYTDLPGYMGEPVRRDLDTHGLVAVFKDAKPDFAPGTKWAYNNSGYVLVGAVIEAITGKPWGTHLDESLFRPLGLAHTRADDGKAIIRGHVEGYSLAADGSVTRAGFLSMSQPHAAGAMVSTLDDLWRWNLALHGGKVLKPATYARMTTPQGVAAKAPGHYGFGIQRRTLRGHTMITHSGGIHGFLSNLIYLPDSGLTAVALRNADSRAPFPIDRRLLAFALGDAYPADKAVPVDAAELAEYEGIYRLDADTKRTLRVVDGKLTSLRSGGSPLVLTPIGGGRFLFPDTLSRIEMQRGKDGKVDGLHFFPDGEDGELWRRTDEKPIERTPVDLPLAARQAVVGDYAGDALSFKVFIDDAGTLRVQVPGQPAFELHAETPRRFFLREVDASVIFDPAEGPVQTATLEQGGARIPLARKP
ncbi:MAG TPA: serine hydrolase domain-containing protein [Dokdonella sp.]|uniref:serine hydrolase domain-containing protein n=1 Tax=Dokdonella sp. TaxID=2291710 RepID=UPI0025BCEB87|nr:serine hydrolase domain-containing protein [Dokdonella sp.]MBX3691501.1 serine hydrolase [Dokdonella sp.]MCW5566758.1 serine hydrolase [Dokdonella sp.]HNR91053.1 serine hydrolase domain-containing protein [Dokdonella sp.]